MTDNFSEETMRASEVSKRYQSLWDKSHSADGCSVTAYIVAPHDKYGFPPSQTVLTGMVGETVVSITNNELGLGVSDEAIARLEALESLVQQTN